ncbi:hypothetical protein A5798_002024 [Enterococcus sp. 6C8_DIV0013]|nr:hypothetical protein A5798_002024 [Enterococcus sp. 6C8_DIV0013]
MTYLVAIVAFITFFGFQILIEKKKIPKILQEQKLLGIILISILGISVSLILAVLTKIVLIPVVVTLFFASVISWKYREKFKEMESGKEHV